MEELNNFIRNSLEDELWNHERKSVLFYLKGMTLHFMLLVAGLLGDYFSLVPRSFVVIPLFITFVSILNFGAYSDALYRYFSRSEIALLADLLKNEKSAEFKSSELT